MKPCLLREQGDWNVVLKLQKVKRTTATTSLSQTFVCQSAADQMGFFLVYLIIFCVRSSSKRPLEESITWRKPRPKEIRSAGFMAFCWLGGQHRRYSNMVQRHLNSHVKDFSSSSRNECRERSERYVVGIRK